MNIKNTDNNDCARCGYASDDRSEFRDYVVRKRKCVEVTQICLLCAASTHFLRYKKYIKKS